MVRNRFAIATDAVLKAASENKTRSDAVAYSHSVTGKGDDTYYINAVCQTLRTVGIVDENNGTLSLTVLGEQVAKRDRIEQATREFAASKKSIERRAKREKWSKQKLDQEIAAEKAAIAEEFGLEVNDF